jgi:hypothetical protein
MFGLRTGSIELVAYRVARLLAVIGVCAALTAVAMGIFFSPFGAMEQPGYNDLIGFGTAFTIAGAAAAAIVLLCAGERTLAAEVAAAVVTVFGAAALTAYRLFWAEPYPARSWMDTWSFLRWQHEVAGWGSVLVSFYTPLGLVVGAVVGTIAGALSIVGRRRPRLARWTLLGLLVIGVSEPMRSGIFEAVSDLLVVDQLLFGSAWPNTLPLIWTTAAIFGAIIGATAARVCAGLPKRDRARNSNRASAAATVVVLPPRQANA